MSDERKAHWEQIYAEKAAEDFSWFQARPEVSIALIEAFAPESEAQVIDVGGGDSRLVDELAGSERWELTVLDISGAALERTQERLGDAAKSVTWVETDIVEWTPTRGYDVWHDRAVFHFLVDEADRNAYVRALETGVRDGGYAIIATFGPDGPEQCSGLPCARYDAATLQAAVGPQFEFVEERPETHETPWGATQAFRYTVLKKQS